QARDLLVQIRAQGGLKADAEPAKLAKEMQGNGIKRADERILRQPTEQELKDFLKPIPGSSPQEALKTFETVDGFRMELVAAEPLVYSPVAAAFDEDGNLYVGEMRDYPYEPQPGRLPMGMLGVRR